jgi:non-ribosomal peptide synthetase component E (peptide arylation enzyme)
MEPFLIERMESFRDELAVGEADKACTYANILDRLQFWREKIEHAKIKRGEVVSVEGEYSAEAISVFLALLENDNIIVPLTEAASSQHDTFRQIAGIEKRALF